jgi:GNAT superfamily N-acetyltransferase
VELRLLGWPADSPRLALDHERFAYAGNFRTGRTGIAVALDESVEAGDVGHTADDGGDTAPADDAIVAAASFDEDRAAENALRVRYVSVRTDWRGEGIGPRLLAFVAERALDAGYDVVRIGVNNPIAYQACYRAGFAFTGEESGMGEVVLSAPATEERDGDRYRAGLERFVGRELPADQRAVLDRHRSDDPPARIDIDAE